MRFVLLLTVALAACQPSSETDSSASGTPGTTAVTSATDLPDPSMIEDVSVSGTTELLAAGVRQISPSVAIQTIDLWLVRLDTVSAQGVPEVREDLSSLRDLLQSSPLDGRAIGLRLKRLGASASSLSETTDQLTSLASVLLAAGRHLAPESTEADSDSASVQ